MRKCCIVSPEQGRFCTKKPKSLMQESLMQTNPDHTQHIQSNSDLASKDEQARDSENEAADHTVH